MAKSITTLSRRERQIMDIIYVQGKASASEVMDKLPDAPSYSAVRTLLRILEEKNHLKHTKDGQKFIYMPIVGRDKAKKSAMRHVLKTFFEGSASQAVAALIDMSSKNLSDDELDRLALMIDKAKEEGR